MYWEGDYTGREKKWDLQCVKVPNNQKLEEIIDLYLSLKEIASVFCDKVTLEIDEKKYLIKVTYWTKELMLVDDGNFGLRQVLFELVRKCPICSVEVCGDGILITAQKSFLSIEQMKSVKKRDGGK